MENGLKVLHLDDDPFELERMQRMLADNQLGPQWKVDGVTRINDYLPRLESNPPDIALLDIHLNNQGDSGIQLVDETRKRHPDAVILMCSAMDDVGTIAHCLSLGADDFISKRSDRAEINLRIHQSYQLARLKRGLTDRTQPTVEREKNRREPKVAGATLERIARRVPRILESAVSAVHVEGESGTGKEVVADFFASQLPESTPFVKVNCGAITPSLLESELFGHVRGAFTGALTDKKGLIESASGGWIFLDEVASLSSSAQVALLRVLENQELRRVGASATLKVQVRVLSATNEPLKELVALGKFRKDLWQRLCETEIELPPLRDRAEELPVLIKHFCQAMPGGPYQITETTMEVLSNLPWKAGNVRELRNCLRAMTELHVNQKLTPLSIPERIWKQNEEVMPTTGTSEEEVSPEVPVGGTLLQISVRPPVHFDTLADQLLLELIRKLTSNHGKTSLRRLAKEIGMSRSTLSGRLKMMVHKNLVELKELTQLVGIVEEASSDA